LRIVIALVEYLTSEEAGQPLGKNFAWPVGKLVNCSAGIPAVINGAALNGTVKANGNGHANGYTNGAAKTNGSATTNGFAKANGKKTL
jgi:dihydroceramidase